MQHIQLDSRGHQSQQTELERLLPQIRAFVRSEFAECNLAAAQRSFTMETLLFVAEAAHAKQALRSEAQSVEMIKPKLVQLHVTNKALKEFRATA